MCGFRIPLAAIWALAVFAAALAGCGSGGTHSSPFRTVEFSGYTWRVRSNPTIARGPGPNYFSNSTDNVSVDGNGRLHLRLTHSHGRWYCAEVITLRSFGYGRYTFELQSPVGPALDVSEVVGQFTWDLNPAYHNREIDIEFARFGGVRDSGNGDFVVQPYFHNGNRQKILQSTVVPSTHWFDWRPGVVTFGGTTGTPSGWTYSGPDVPPIGQEHVRINLWLFHGHPPTNHQPFELVMKRFAFSPD